MGAGLAGGTAAIIRIVPDGRGIAWLADVPDGERRDDSSQPVVRREHPVVAMAVLPRRWHEIGESVKELVRRESHDSARSRSSGLSPSARPDPGGLVTQDCTAGRHR